MPIGIPLHLSVSNVEQLSTARDCARWKAVLCLLLLCVLSIDALHVHDPLATAGAPAGNPHHCVLCMAAHLPLAASPIAIVPGPSRRQSGITLPIRMYAYQSLAGFQLYMRPPPAI
ncbi:MAG: hypothetical protein ACR2IF_09140 [Terriglobales bacterium]